MMNKLVNLGLYPRQKTLKVMVLGQAGVGKSALVVRFITRRYIGEYDPTLEKVYNFNTVIDNRMVYFEILDTAGQIEQENGESLTLAANIRWAEAFILMYSVTDKCSFDECCRLKFLINYHKCRKRLGNGSKESITEVPVVLVGNKIDQINGRMVTLEEGQKRSKEIGCVCFHEISVRESIDQVASVFRDVCGFWSVQNKNPSKLKQSGSNNKDPIAPDTIRLLCSATVSSSGFFPSPSKPSLLNRRWTKVEVEENNTKESGLSPSEALFRELASTDRYLPKTWRWRYPPPSTSQQEFYPIARADRRMSI
ncbi:ras-related and estrogen-regulated growth inhibitor-like [Onthophagus taurus]|uniref:ras-related and estrogen-regulated growth inhibitor-like n=1 Tax=Onthophagus taurus TaxID=166361 RepID=UPI0039BE9351